MRNNEKAGRLRRIDESELTRALWPLDEMIVKPRNRMAKNIRKPSRQRFHIKPNHWTWRTWTLPAGRRAQDESPGTS
jgi:hypothetical protein